MTNINEISGFIWGIADSVLRDTYKRNEYQKVILPFTVLKRFDSVLEYSKENVVKTYEDNKDKTSFIDPILKNVAVDEDGKELGFYNYSKYDFNKLLEDPDNIEENLTFYLNSFSENVKNILENFKIQNEVANLSESKILYLLVKKFAQTNIDLSPKNISNHDMGTIFEELIRKFSETSNEEAGEHFTPRDVVKLMTELLLVDAELEDGTIKQVYDPACGTGGMLTSCEEFIHNKNHNTKVVLYGQEINSEIYAICKADMLIKGENAENIKSYETDPTISSLVLLECLILTGNCNDTVHDNIQQFVLSDKSLRGYAVNYELNTVQDIEFAISCKTDYMQGFWINFI